MVYGTQRIGNVVFSKRDMGRTTWFYVNGTRVTPVEFREALNKKREEAR